MKYVEIEVTEPKLKLQWMSRPADALEAVRRRRCEQELQRQIAGMAKAAQTLIMTFAEESMKDRL